MSRIRQVKPSAYKSLSLASVPIQARYLFHGLLCEADDAGRLVDHVALISAAIFPIDKLTDETVESWLQQLHDAEVICRYVGSDGRHYLHMPKWKQHQYVNKPTPSTLPGCPLHTTATAADAPAEAPTAPAAQLVLADPRRCSRHQNDRDAPACGACKDARIAYERAEKARPTFTTKTTMCGEHPEHPARACPECAAAVTPPPADWRGKAVSS